MAHVTDETLNNAIESARKTVNKFIESDYEDYSILPDKVSKWVKQCYNTPSDTELEMAVIDVLIDGYGVEGITPEGKVYPVAEYVNMGDTYDLTVVYDLENGEYILTSWGDFLSEWEKNND